MFTKSVTTLLLLALCVFSATARNFHITNNCGSTVTITSPTSAGQKPIQDNIQLAHGESKDVPADDKWVGNFNVNGSPGSLAEFALSGWNGLDFYDISLVDGFSLPIKIAPGGGCKTLVCNAKPCDDGYNFSSDDTKTNSCSAGPDYAITYCP